MSSKQSIYDQAYAAVQNKEYGFARRLLGQLLKQEPSHLHGWLLASYAMKTRAEAIECLERALQIDPKNEHAERRLAKLQQNSQKISPDPSPTLLLYISSERPTVPPAEEFA
jgi:tetratricopeptide (TPR) repeat protein